VCGMPNRLSVKKYYSRISTVDILIGTRQEVQVPWKVSIEYDYYTVEHSLNSEMKVHILFN